jgi:hypothetical protein
MTTNEAAERLRDWIEATFETPSMRAVAVDYLDAALAEERRHVIEQIRERMIAVGGELTMADLNDLPTPEQPA